MAGGTAKAALFDAQASVAAAVLLDAGTAMVYPTIMQRSPIPKEAA